MPVPRMARHRLDGPMQDVSCLKNDSMKKICFLSLALLLCACGGPQRGSGRTPQAEVPARTVEAELAASGAVPETAAEFDLEERGEDAAGQPLGGDRDEHGCIPSAGYSWSAVRGACIRPFEEGVAVRPVDDPGATYAVYIVFAQDSTRAELFLPQAGMPPVLERRALPGGGWAWNAADDDTYNVRRLDGRWTVSRRGHVLYVQPWMD